MSVADHTLANTRGKSRRLVFGVLGLLLMALLALMVVSLSWLKHDRADLAARFSKDRLLAITDVAREVESDIEDITEDLFLAARLMRTVSASETHRDLLEAILSVGKAYQAFIVFGPDGGVEHFLTDPRRGGPPLEKVISVAEESASASLREEGEGIKVSSLLVDGEKTIRMFTVKLSKYRAPEIQPQIAQDRASRGRRDDDAPAASKTGPNFRGAVPRTGKRRPAL